MSSSVVNLSEMLMVINTAFVCILTSFVCVSSVSFDTKVILYESLLKSYMAFKEEQLNPVFSMPTRRFLLFSSDRDILGSIAETPTKFLKNVLSSEEKSEGGHHFSEDIEICGVTKTHENSSNRFNRIVGGEDAEYGAWPWMAALAYDVAGGVKFLCGGTLITRKHVLTAAHCVYDHPALRSVLLGATVLTEEEEEGAMRIAIVGRRVHEFYEPDAHSNDIAILLLDMTVPFTDTIRAACLPTSTTFEKAHFASQNAIVAGWGALTFGGEGTPVLQQVEVNVLDEEICIDAYKALGQVMGSGILCAGYINGTKDACQGDSGGPLVSEHDGAYYLIGIVSFGFRCAEKHFPGVYTNVAYFNDWIVSSIHRLS